MSPRRVLRARIPARHRSVLVEGSRTGVRLTIGDLHLPLSKRHALALADALVDAAENGGTP